VGKPVLKPVSAVDDLGTKAGITRGDPPITAMPQSDLRRRGDDGGTTTARLTREISTFSTTHNPYYQHHLHIICTRRKRGTA